MMYNDPHNPQHQHQFQQQQQHPQQQQQQQQHFHHQQQPGPEFHRGPPPPMPQQPPPMLRQPSASSSTIPPEFHHPGPGGPPGPPPHYDVHNDIHGAKRMRKLTQRKAVDYTSTVVRYMQIRMSQRDSRDRTVLQPTPAAAIDMLPAAGYSDNPSTSFAAKFVHTSLNKNRCPINRVLWTPTGRRLITGSQTGEFTLWNGQSFNFEMILQAHDQAIRSMVWSHNDNWMVSGDDGGAIKYWQNNMNNVKANKSAHKESVRDLRTDLKFCSCSDDTTVKVWDFARCQEECSLTGHGWDVKSVDWHPTKSLLVSGGKDNLVKLWDAKSGKELCSFHGHKNTVLCVKWNQNGNWVLTASKDQIIKVGNYLIMFLVLKIEFICQYILDDFKTKTCSAPYLKCHCRPSPSPPLLSFPILCEVPFFLVPNLHFLRVPSSSICSSIVVSPSQIPSSLLHGSSPYLKCRCRRLPAAAVTAAVLPYFACEFTLIDGVALGSSVLVWSFSGLYDIRAMKELESFRGHRKDVTSK
ncbi:hypothetical protein TSUD_363840 [Trifolium subterraneum]|uniref:Uncharacterized protein n=1 Tax=Trifolium subterraneum TaxID=3900 RepID=A0A2Z6NSV3_TRISU|nr:hypothetical protein TSUD_363840 [Trifolium subterraneum]